MSKIESFEVENPPNYLERKHSDFYDDEEDNKSFNNSSINDYEEKNRNSLDINNNNENNNNNNDKNSNNKKSFNSFTEENQIYGILNLLASVIGAGCVTFPSLLQTAGVITSLLIFSIVSISIYFSLDLLRNFVITTRVFSFAGIIQNILGISFLKIYAFSSVIFYLSIEVNYINLIVEYAGKAFFVIEKTYLWIIFYLVTCVIEILLCFFTSKISHVHILSLISVLCFIFIVIVVIIYSFGSFKKENLKDKFVNNMFMPPSDSIIKFIMSIFSCFIEYLYSYACHSSFPTLIRNLKPEKTKKVVNIFFISTAIMYFIISIFGYISQINVDDQKKTIILFTDNESLQSFFNKILEIVITVFFLCLIPIRFIVIRDNYSSILPFKITNEIELTFISVNIIIANVISYFCTIDSNIIFSLNEIFGGIFGVVICFVLPVLTHALISNKCEKKSILGYIMAGFFLIIGIFTAIYSFLEKILKVI